MLAGECEAPGGSRWVRGVPSLLQAFLPGAPPASHREDWGKPGKNSLPGLGVLAQEPLRIPLRPFSLKQQEAYSAGGRV